MAIAKIVDDVHSVVITSVYLNAVEVAKAPESVTTEIVSKSLGETLGTVIDVLGANAAGFGSAELPIFAHKEDFWQVAKSRDTDAGLYVPQVFDMS